MCGRYNLKSGKVRETVKFHERDLIPQEFRESRYNNYNISPTTTVPVMQEIGVWEPMHWWLIPGYSKEFVPDDTMRMFNKKVETLNKPYWQKLLKYQRCVFPMTGIIEWTKTEPKKVYNFEPTEDDLFYLAGFYDIWRKVDPGSGEIIEERKSATILTTTPNKLFGQYHDRMAVFLDPQNGDVGKWLDKNYKTPQDLLKIFPSERMKVTRIGSAIGKSTLNYPELLDPVPEDPTLF